MLIPEFIPRNIPERFSEWTAARLMSATALDLAAAKSGAAAGAYHQPHEWRAENATALAVEWVIKNDFRRRSARCFQGSAPAGNIEDRCFEETFFSTRFFCAGCGRKPLELGEGRRRARLLARVCCGESTSSGKETSSVPLDELGRLQKHSFKVSCAFSTLHRCCRI